MNDFKDKINLDKIDVLILCGGFGTRLRPVISDKPKVLAKIGNITFLDILIENLSLYRFKNFILCIGYLKDHIKEHYKNNNHDCNIIFSEEDKPLGTGGTIKNAEHLIKNNNFLVTNGDSICKIDYDSLKIFHVQKNSLISIVLSKNILKDDLQYGFIEIDDQQRIISFNEKSFKKEKLINAGIYMMNKKIFNHMPNRDYFSLENDLFPEIIKSNNCFGFVTNSKVIDIGTPKRYEEALKFIEISELYLSDNR